MAKCPRCQQLVDSQAIKCPHCNNPLKAFGHPGITLYQATETDYLCDRCTYHEDDTCTFPQRPYAKTCTLFHDKSKPLVEETNLSSPSGIKAIKIWCDKNKALLILIVLIAISVLLASA